MSTRPDYTLRPDAMEQGWTNHVARGIHQGRDVVLKYFIMEERWRNELFCMRHFGPTDLVPALHDIVDGKLIVMGYVPGTMPRRDGIDEAILADLGRRKLLSRDLGQATDKISILPLPTDSEGRFPPPGFMPFEPTGWTDDVASGIHFIVDLARRIEREVPAYQTDLFEETLALLEYACERVADERKILFRFDFGNLNVLDGRLQGIFDLESCRLGTESMQLSKGLACCPDYGLDRAAFLAGYEEVTGTRPRAEDHLILLSMQQLERLLRVCRGGNWDGSDAHKKQAEQIAQGSLDDLARTVETYRPWIDVHRWFPSLVGQ